MPKLLCACGYVINLTPIPRPTEYLFFATERWDECVDELVKAIKSVDRVDLDILEERISDTLAGFGHRFYKCPNCGGLVVFWPGSDGGGYFAPTDPNRGYPIEAGV